MAYTAPAALQAARAVIGSGVTLSCRRPRKRVIQYAAASRFYHWRLWNTRRPVPSTPRLRRGPGLQARRSFGEGGKPGDDGCGEVVARIHISNSQAVIASAAKQSIEPLEERMDCRVASLLAMTADTASPARDALRPRFTGNLRPQKNRGRRECRMRAAPAVSCAMCTGSAHTSIQGSGEHPTFPAQWLYGLLRALPGEPSTFATVDASIGASGPHDFAVRVSTVRYRHLRVHRIPPHVRDDHDTPLLSGETGRPYADFIFCKTEIYLIPGLDMISYNPKLFAPASPRLRQGFAKASPGARRARCCGSVARARDVLNECSRSRGNRAMVDLFRSLHQANLR